MFAKYCIIAKSFSSMYGTIIEPVKIRLNNLYVKILIAKNVISIHAIVFVTAKFNTLMMICKLMDIANNFFFLINF